MLKNSILFKNNELDMRKWQELIENTPFVSPFQGISFYRFIKSQKNMDAEVFAVQGIDGRYSCLAVIVIMYEAGLKKFISSRAIIYGGPLVENKIDIQDFSFLLSSIWDVLKAKVIYFEIRNLADYSFSYPTFRKLGWDYLPYLNIKIEITFNSIEEYLKSLGYNRRRQIKLSEKAGLIYKLVETELEIEKIYFLLRDLYKKKLKLPLPSLSFFQGLWRSGTSVVFAVFDGTEIVGGAFCPFVEKKKIYTFYYCGLKNYKKNVYPTHLAILACIEYAINNGIKTLDFMGAGLKSEPYGVREYKMEFGGRLIEEGRFRKISKPFLFKIGKSFLQLSKRMRFK
jgi:serine/alanine adding enzyme